MDGAALVQQLDDASRQVRVDAAQAALDTATADLKTANAQLQSTVDSLGAQNADLTTKNSALTGQVTTLNSQITTLQSKVADLTKQVADLKSQLNQTIVMKYGVSATSGNFNTGYTAQVKTLNAKVGYLYGQDPRFADWSAVPDDHDLWLQTKATDRASYDAMLASFPRTRKGKVYLHYHNEPEDNVESGSLPLATWQARQDALFAAIDASGLGGPNGYVKKSVELMVYTLQKTNSGTTSPARIISNYIRPGTQQIGFSAYAQKKISNGHEVATTNPAHAPGVMKAFADANGLGWSVITGWALGTAYLSDPISVQNRADWLAAWGPALAKAGSQHLMWFDIPWNDGDYRIATDQKLFDVWKTLAV